MIGILIASCVVLSALLAFALREWKCESLAVVEWQEAYEASRQRENKWARKYAASYELNARFRALIDEVNLATRKFNEETERDKAT